MARKRTTVQQLAIEARLDIDEALITLWDGGFDYIKSPGDVVSKGDVNRARRALGIATRRELGSRDYWQRELGMSAEAFDNALLSLGLKKLPSGGQLPKKAIRRILSELRAGEILARQDRERSQERQADEQAKREQQVPFRWEQVGHERELRMLTAEEILAVHNALVADFRDDTDPIAPPGVRSETLFQSAVFRPHTSINGMLKYPTVEMAAAALFHALVHDHPFHNGNKRTALVAMLVFLDANRFMMTCDEDALFKLVVQLAQHAITSGPRNEMADRETLVVAKWIAGHARWIQVGDRPLSWRRLRRILTRLGCVSEVAAGQRLNIERRIVRQRPLFGPKAVQLLSSVHFVDDGREVDKGLISRVRRELELDEAHGVDSAAFYDDQPGSTSEFIVTYRVLLRRLAKV